ncbi:Maf family protein [Geotalea uraniireducens]|uniref:Uncharacterized protein n=1 Tax=Geotalea uraniireducens (strain Rf4) TaxID=351605 RepID=A5GBN9_GEOUR|nr:hypothetical protein [Geotalea uraniireducens]ABQ24999.1 hypothetical protein Gura_0791 [Geotalea uraniireducens Rf4]
MKVIKRLYKWSIEPWPLHLFPVFVSVHLFSLRIFQSHNQIINSNFSAAFQIIGGLIIIWVINSNLGIVSKTSIKNSIFDWLKRFPLIAKQKSVNLQVDSLLSASGIYDARLIPGHKNTEEKVEFLLQEVNRIHDKIDKTRDELKRDIRTSEDRISIKINTIKTDINEINTNLKAAIVGGVKAEALGVLTVAYGIAIPIIYKIA